MEGCWVLHTRRAEPVPQGADRFGLLLVRFTQTADGIRMYMDLDEDGAFGENISLGTGTRQGGVEIKGDYIWEGCNYQFEALVWEHSWGHAAGDVTVSSDKQELRTDLGVLLKIANPPLADLNGTWELKHVTEWASGPLTYLTGFEEYKLWNIQQHMEGPMQGFFEAHSPSGECFIGIVNDTQITLANRYVEDGWTYTLTYTNVNADGDWLEGTHIARSELGSLVEEIGWTIEGVRVSQ